MCSSLLERKVQIPRGLGLDSNDRLFLHGFCFVLLTQCRTVVFLFLLDIILFHDLRWYNEFLLPKKPLTLKQNMFKDVSNYMISCQKKIKKKFFFFFCIRIFFADLVFINFSQTHLPRAAPKTAVALTDKTNIFVKP